MTKKLPIAQVKAFKAIKASKPKEVSPARIKLQEWLWCLDGYRSVRKAKDVWYKTKCLVKPKHPTIRKAIPRTWADITYLIVEVNFAMIKDFYYGEAITDIIDWNATKHHKAFYSWLKRAVKYIEKDRPALEKQMNEAYPDYGPDGFSVDNLNKGSYHELYGDVNRIEALIWRKDTKLLKEMIDHREHFWT